MPTSICNEALAEIGQSVIVDINYTTNDAARSCKLLFEPTARQVMRLHPWNCLKARQQLALNDTPVFGWDYSYTLPTQCVRLMTVNGYDETSNYKEDYYEIEGRDILTDATSCKITYIGYNENVPQWDPLLRRCVITLLASKLAFRLSQDTELGGFLAERFKRVDLPEAQKIDANERRKRFYDPVGDSPWIAARKIQPG